MYSVSREVLQQQSMRKLSNVWLLFRKEDHLMLEKSLLSDEEDLRQSLQWKLVLRNYEYMMQVRKVFLLILKTHRMLISFSFCCILSSTSRECWLPTEPTFSQNRGFW